MADHRPVFDPEHYRRITGKPYEGLWGLERVATTVWQAESFAADVKELRGRMGYAEEVKTAKAALARLRKSTAGLSANTASMLAAVDMVEKMADEVKAADVELRAELAEFTNAGPAGPLPGQSEPVKP